MFIDYAKSKKVYTQLSSASTKTVKILRNGSLVEVSVSDILVGDVMKLKSGDFISVDGVLV
jgi:Ca2+-transporting ATPase